MTDKSLALQGLVAIYVNRNSAPRSYINGGRRGYLVGIHPHDILRTLAAKAVDAALPG